METKDPNFNIHDYVDLSDIEDPGKLRIYTETLQGFADSPVLDGQSFIKKCAEAHGGKIAMHADDSTPSAYYGKYGVNMNFEQISKFQYMTEATPENLSYKNFSYREHIQGKSTQNFTFAETLWHEMAHSIFNQPTMLEAFQFKVETYKFKRDLSAALDNTELPTPVKQNITNLNVREFAILSHFDKETRDNMIGGDYNQLTREVPELNIWSDKAKFLSAKYVEQDVIDFTNKNFREPMGLPKRYTHYGKIVIASTPIESFPELDERLFKEKLPEIELYYKGVEITEEVDIEELAKQSYAEGGSVVSWEEAPMTEDKSPNIDKPTQQTAPSKERG